MTTQPTFDRVRAAVIKAWFFALLFGAVAVTIYTLRGGSSFERSVPALKTVLVAYLIGATVAGMVVGFLEPWRTTKGRQWIIGVIAAWPACYLGFGLLGMDFHLSVGRIILISAASAVYSAIFVTERTP